MEHLEDDIDFATLDLLPYGVIVLDQTGMVLYYNEREEEIAGRVRANVLGRNFFSEIAPCTRVRAFQEPFAEALRRQERLASFRFLFPFADAPREVDITLTGFEHDGILLCLVTVADVTEMQVVRERIMQSERMRQAAEVAMGVAHNFNNLLMVISGNAEMLKRRLGDDHPELKRLGRILAACEDGRALMARIGAATRSEPTTITTLADLSEIAREAVAMAELHAAGAASRGARVTVRASVGEPVLVPGDAAELREVVLNLLRNAVDAIASLGTVEVSTAREKGNGVLRVRDDGAGMEPGVAERAFLPLFTTKGTGGMGLGLATCHAIVRRHGGEIRLETVPGRGTTFTVCIPFAPAPHREEGR